MKYVAPYGIADPDAPYINGDPSIGRMGSIPPAEAFEHPMRELVGVIEASKIVPDDDDLEQVAVGVRSQRMNYAEDTGDTNTLTVAYDPPIESYTLGLVLCVKVKNGNSGPSTIDAGPGRVQIKRPTGAQLAVGDLLAGGLVHLAYDGTAFQMLNYLGSGTGATTTVNVKIPYCVDTGTVNTIVANFAPAVAAPDFATGLIVMVKVATTNTGPTTININGLGAKSVYAQGNSPGWPLLPGDLHAGDVLVFIYDGTQFWIYPSPSIDANTTFNVSTNAQYDQIMVALGRKRINANVAVIIKFAAGRTYAPISVYHVDASRMTIEGTMTGAVPLGGELSRSGNTGSARANDSANNIVLFRSRYATEFIFTNAMFGIPMGNAGPGKPMFKNLLLTGPNVSAGSDAYRIAAFGTALGNSLSAVGIAIWGMGSDAFLTNGGTLDLTNCIASGNYGNGFTASAGGTVGIAGGSSVGNGGSGIRANAGGTITTGGYTAGGIPAPQYVVNGGYGMICQGSAHISMGDGQCSSNALTDVYATESSYIRLDSLVAAVTFSPAPYTYGGNYNSFITN